MNERTYEERAREEKFPLQLKIYKGMSGSLGAMRWNLKKAWTDSHKAEGVVFLEMCPTIGPNNYDWKNQKMIMALGITDIPKIILYLRSHKLYETQNKVNELSIYHDKGAGTASKGQSTKTLSVSHSDETHNFFFKMYQKDGDKTMSATVTASPGEALAIGVLLQAAIPRILAW